MRTRFAALGIVAGLLFTPSAHAAHHLWDFTEIFSNADGSVQFVEIFTAEDNEQNLNGFTITSGGNTLTFTSNLPTAATANTWLLAATSNFAALPGAVTPDYIIPANFFPTGGGTLNYASGADVWNFGAVPTDGVLALQRNGSSATNSPTNFAGEAGSIDLGTPVPAMSTWAIFLAVGVILLLASGLLRRRTTAIA
jgi:hypothetical protein